MVLTPLTTPGEVGNASKMNLVLQVMAGVTLAGLAEGMALADRAGLQQKDVMEIMELTSLACPLMVEKGKGMHLTHLYKRAKGKISLLSSLTDSCLFDNVSVLCILSLGLIGL